jgi:hypothetical protein
LVQRFLAPFGPPSVDAALIVVRGIQISTLYFIFESGLLRFWARHVLGKWGYRSDSGNFGLATITLAYGEFKYRVELYRKPGEVAAAMEGDAVVQPFAHVYSRLSKYEDGKFDTDYHIEYTDGVFPKRKGLLTLLPTSDRRVLTGNWETMYEGAKLRSGRLDCLREPSFIHKYVHTESSPVSEPLSTDPASPAG